jgi:hypothetical protein
MKAEIKSNGDLVIIAQTGLESYALKQWFEQYQKNEVIFVIKDSIDAHKQLVAFKEADKIRKEVESFWYNQDEGP